MHGPILVEIGPHIGLLIDVLVPVEILQRTRLDDERSGEHTIGVLEPVDAVLIDLLHLRRFLHHIDSDGRMRIADEVAAFVDLAILAACSHQLSILFDEFLDFGIANHLASHRLDLFHQSVHDEVSIATQTIGALDERIVALGEVIEWQSVLGEFHLERRTAQYIDQQLIVERLVQEVVGARSKERLGEEVHLIARQDGIVEVIAHLAHHLAVLH